MSFLTPLYILGALAVVGPILFHLIRRSPKGEVPFSSLMFLSPTPPRLTRRSRLDNILLLILRGAVLCLLAAAFARPFLRESARLDFGEVPRQRTVVLIDTSASMRRGDLWAKAKRLAAEAIAAARPTDELAVLAFDATSRPLLGFEESATLDPARRQAVAQSRLKGLEPTWASTDLGRGLIDAVAAIEDVADKGEKAGRMPRRVVLISDLQQGSKLDALGDFEWPSDVELELKTVADPGSNAGLSLLADPAEVDPADLDPQRRVRVSNDPGSNREKFALTWGDDKGADAGPPIEVYVPPGESRVVRVPRPSGPATLRLLKLTGDVHAFDNTLYVADERREEATVLFVGSDSADDSAGLLYYLQRVFQDTPRRAVHVVPTSPSSPLKWEAKEERSTPLVIVSGETSSENGRRLRQYLQGGGTVLVVLTTPGKASTLGALADASLEDVSEAGAGALPSPNRPSPQPSPKGRGSNSNTLSPRERMPEGQVRVGSSEQESAPAANIKTARDVMLGEIAFDHPLFAPLAGPGFNDFTKIRFWKHRQIPDKMLEGGRVVARFEGSDPAVIEKAVGKGRLIVMASGWQPADSQLARSSKFVPMMSALLELRDPRPFNTADLHVNDRVPLPAEETATQAKRRVVHKPSGATVETAVGSAAFAETDEPGVYTVETSAGGGARSFAVNLDPSESKTAPLHVETLEQFGCRLSNPLRKQADAEQLRQMHNGELEGRQKLWRWLILTAIGVLVVETLLAGRLSRPSSARAEALAT